LELPKTLLLPTRLGRKNLVFLFPLLCDNERSLCDLFGGVKRWAVLIDKERKVKAFWPEVVDKEGFAAEALKAV